jgi:hypothetical protein
LPAAADADAVRVRRLEEAKKRRTGGELLAFRPALFIADCGEVMPSPPTNFSLLAWMQGNQPGWSLYLRLYQGSMDAASSPQLGDFMEADFEGYEEQPFYVEGEPTITSEVFGRMQSQAAVFRYAEDGESSNIIGGFYVVARFLDDSEILVVWSVFNGQEVFAQGRMPLGVVVMIDANLVLL